MAAGTVISGGFPGRVAQEVHPNQKCSGCLHYDGQGGRTGVCTIGERPWNCGTGDAQDVGYAPIARGAGAYLPDMTARRMGAPDADPQEAADLYGAGSTRPVQVRQVTLGEEHVHFVKSLVARHSDFQKSQCRLCSMAGAHGVAPCNVGIQFCTCAPITAESVAKALTGRLSNALREAYDADELAEWVRDVAKAGFRLPVPRRPRSFGRIPAGRLVDNERRRELRSLNRPARKKKTSLTDQVKIDSRAAGHAVSKGTLYHQSGKYDVTPAGGGKQHVDFSPHAGGAPTRIGTFGSHGAARTAAIQHGERLASGTGGRATPSSRSPTMVGTRTPKNVKAANVGSDVGKGSSDSDDGAVAGKRPGGGRAAGRDRR